MPKETVARNVPKKYRPHERYWPTGYLPVERMAAWEKFEPRFPANPELRTVAETYQTYFASPR